MAPFKKRPASRPASALERMDEELARRSLKHFVRQAWAVLYPGTEFVENLAVEAICLHLEAVRAGEIRDLLVNVPPRSLKSTIATICFPAWWWIEEPWTKFLCSSYAQTLSTRHSVACRRVIESEWYRKNWGDRYRLTSDQNEKTRFENDKRGERLATSVGGANLGEGGDVVICDDPHDRKSVLSEVKRVEAVDWWNKTMSTRRNDLRTSRRIVVMQRLHEADVSGSILAKEDEDWQHLCLPMRFEPPRKCVTVVWEDPRKIDGELLDPVRVPEPELKKLEDDLEDDAPGQLQQRPVRAGGHILKREWWVYFCDDPVCMGACGWPVLPAEFDCSFTSWDCTFKDGRKSDFVCGGFWSLLEADCFLRDLRHDRMSFTRTCEEIAAFADLHPEATFHLVEDKANGPAVIDSMKRKVRALLPFNPGKDGKEARAHAVSPIVKAGNAWLPFHAHWVKPFVKECADFPRAPNDDRVDMTTQALIHVQQKRFVEGIG